MTAIVVALVAAGVWAVTTGTPSASAANSQASQSGVTSGPRNQKQSTTHDGPTAKAHSATAPSTVAAVFGASSTDHSCSAGVISSLTRDLLVTAAHCVRGDGTGIAVVPGYDSGMRPYGTWSVVAVFVDPAWATTQSQDDDFAILRVAPQPIDGRTQQLQDVTGAVPLGTTPAQSAAVTVQGFNNGSDDQSVVCTTALAFNQGDPVFRCDGYANGSSGSPWVLTGADHVARIVGVIGGRNQGGCKEVRSFSPVFGANVLNLLKHAEVSTGGGDTVPSAPPSTACAQP